jgi:hypothetical protein
MILRGLMELVELVCQEVLPPHLPCSGDIRLAVRVASNGFTGEYDGVWVGADEFRRFLTDLRTLQETRQGAAVVEALSPEKFRLALRAVDGAGHLVAEGRLGRWVFARYWHAIEFSFEFCPSLLAQAVRDFEQLGQPDT